MRILEIGTAYGYSALFFARRLPDAHITTIDRNEHMIPVAEQNFACRPEGRRIDFRKGDADAILDQIADEMNRGETEPFDFIFSLRTNSLC